MFSVNAMVLLTYSFRLFPKVDGQVAHAVCTDSLFQWSFNTKGQSPCQIGEALGSQCGLALTIPPLSTGFFYSGMDVQFATPCVCNTVYYSLLSVCAVCQGGFADEFQFWDANCTNALSTYPKPILAGTVVPNWAYLPLFANGTINIVAALEDNGPEITGTAVPSTGPGSSTKTNIGAIVGGVVGGLVFIGLIVGIFVFFLLRQRKERNKSMAPANNGTLLTSPLPFLPSDNRYTYSPTTSHSPFNEKAYNPDDPSTYPTGLAMSAPPPFQSLPPNLDQQKLSSIMGAPHGAQNLQSSPQSTGMPLPSPSFVSAGGVSANIMRSGPVMPMGTGAPPMMMGQQVNAGQPQYRGVPEL